MSCEKWWAKHRRKVGSYSLIGLTSALLVGFFVTIRHSASMQDAANWGDTLAGFAGALAFLWLVAGFYLQREELKLQRRELALQRDATQQQAKEMRATARFASLTQVDNILSTAERTAADSGLVKRSYQLFSVWRIRTEEWVARLKSTDRDLVNAHFLQWREVEGVVVSYLNSVATAMLIYNEHSTTPIAIPNNLPPEELLSKFGVNFMYAPYLINHLGTARIISETRLHVRDRRLQIEVAGLASFILKEGKESVEESVFNRHIEELKARNLPLPAICKQLGL